MVAKPVAKGRGSPKKAGTAKNKTQLPTLSHVTEKEGGKRNIVMVNFKLHVHVQCIYIV